MLKLTLLPDEYITINDTTVVQLLRISGGRADIAVHADRSVPVMRGTVLERNGGERPACLAPPPRKKARYYRDQIFRWNDDREAAVRTMKKIFRHMESSGSAREAEALEKLLDRIIPAFWESELTAE